MNPRTPEECRPACRNPGTAWMTPARPAAVLSRPVQISRHGEPILKRFISAARTPADDWPRQERQTKLKRFNPGSPWRVIWAGRAGAPEALQAGPGSFRPGGSSCRPWGPFADPGWSPAGLGGNFIVFRIFWDWLYISDWFLDSYKDYIKLLV